MGFQGRTNKLVDGCYSFWQGGLFPLLHQMLGDTDRNHWLFDQGALQEYILICCQDLRGGLVDKPAAFRWPSTSVMANTTILWCWGTPGTSWFRPIQCTTSACPALPGPRSISTVCLLPC